MDDRDDARTDRRQSLHQYVSDRALSVLSASPGTGWVSIEGSLAFFDISGFTKLTERLAALGRSGAEHINDVLNTVFTGLIGEVFRYGGDVLEFGGDAMVVLFTGEEHPRRAAAATTDMFRWMSTNGRVSTPAGNVRLSMSCGLASGEQAYHVLGQTRRALVVAGPVSSAMASLEAGADAGEALIDQAMIAAVPDSWVERRPRDGAARLRFGKVRTIDRSMPSPLRPRRDDAAIATLLPTQFRALIRGPERTGELKQVAMSFVRLDGTDDLLAADGIDGLHQRLTEITDIIDRASADLDVCWLETQAESNSVRWTLIAGAPTATERDGERLLRVVRRIADESPSQLRIGANLGVVFVGDMGHPQRCTYIVMGDATNLAARLMAKAAPGQILAGERLQKTCPHSFRWASLEPFLVKGKRAPVNAFVVEGLADAADDERWGEDALDIPMVGRDRELDQLLSAIRNGAMVELVGDAGVGKTRLWHEARHIENQRRWFVMRAEPHETGAAYLPFRRLVRTMAGIDHNADELVAGAGISAFVSAHAPELTPWLPLIADVVGAAVESTPEVDALDPTFRPARAQAVVAELVVAGAGADAVIVFEDLQWSDEASRGIVEVIGHLDTRAIAVVLTRRPDGWKPTSAASIDVEPIAPEFAEELLLRALPTSAASDATLARLEESAAGNPLYLIELARAVAASTGQDDDYPETLERLLAARLDQLPTRGRELIRDASVLGSTINCGLAARVLSRDDLADAEVWERELGDLVVIDADVVRFRHDLVRKAAYEGLSVRRRRAVHRRAGDVIEEWGASVPVDDPLAALAFHASGSGLPERIVRWNAQAAEAAIGKGAMEVAERLLGDVGRAQVEVKAPASERCSTARRLAFAAERAGHPESALGAIDGAVRLVDADQRALLDVDRARLLEKLGRYRRALVLTARALKVCHDDAVARHLLLARATIRNFRGEWKDCLSLCRTLLADEAAAGDRRLLAQAHLLAEWCCACLGLPERAEHEANAFRLLTELDDSIGLANLMLNRGASAWREGRVTDAIDDLRSSSAHYTKAGDVVGAALADNNLAEIFTLQFRLDEAEALLTHARRVTLAANYPHGTLATISGLSRIAAWRGDADRALALQLEALDGFRELGADDFLVDSLVRLVEIHVLANDPAEALRVVAKAETALAALGSVPIVPATLCRLTARALWLAGRQDESRRQLEKALSLATADGFTYEIALDSIGLARLDGDAGGVDAALEQLAGLGVLAPPPPVDQLATWKSAV